MQSKFLILSAKHNIYEVRQHSENQIFNENNFNINLHK